MTTPSYHIYNLTEITAKRRRLRRQMTATEVLLWQRLRGGQILGLRFRRQYSVGPFILDFYCPAARLAIEIDGQTHQHEIAAAYDQRRQSYVEGFDITFLRLTNEQVTYKLSSVIETIVEAIRTKNLPPTPS